jgi:hypothetical protein
MKLIFIFNTVLLRSRAMRPALTRKQLSRFLRAHGITTQAEYGVLRRQLRARRDPVAAALPALQRRDFERLGCDWYELLGVAPSGRGSARARARDPSFSLYDGYADARRAARAGRFRNQSDYRARRAKVDPRLPVDPEQRWPRAFARDGWPGYLGTGAANHELSGLVSQCEVFKALGISHAEWKRLLNARSIVPAARRRRRNADELWFRVGDVVALARAIGVVDSTVAKELRERLKRSVYGLRAQTS